jgi:hypothetical protein
MNRKKLFFIAASALTLAVFFFFSQRKSTPEDMVSAPLPTPEQIPQGAHRVEVVAKDEAPAMKLSIELSQLPTMNDMQDLSEEEVHLTPTAVTKAGYDIGVLLEEAQKNPEKQEATVKLLLGCADNKDIVPAIRALCWKKALLSMPKWNKPVPLSDYNVPVEIQALGERIN